ncbi:MAG: ribonuclease HII [Treponema sp.]|nr:ribonuclease HII [Treponema sp.]MBR5032478.1 ribonuclease HII [Treponema sp.]
MILTVGFDEAGRGPLAGPVCAGAVILPPDFPIEILNDSKKLSEKKRLAAEEVIKQRAFWGIGLVDHKTIDEINILQASMLAMRLAWEDLQKRFGTGTLNECTGSLRLSKGPQSITGITGITDGTRCPDVPFECHCEPKADGKYPCVMAASIIAKNCRDRIMIEMDKKYPGYGYAVHKGYPTKAHREICHKLGPSPIQRMSFKY